MTKKQKEQIKRAIILIHCLGDYWAGMAILKNLCESWPSVDYWEMSSEDKAKANRRLNQWVKNELNGCKKRT